MARALARLAGSVTRHSPGSRWFRVWEGCRRCGMCRTLGAAPRRGRAGRLAPAGPSRSISRGPSVPDHRTNRITTRATAMASAMMAIVRVLMVAPSGWGATVEPTPIHRSSRGRVAGRARRAAANVPPWHTRGRRAALAAAQPWSSCQRTWLCPHRPRAGIRSASRLSRDRSEREAGAALGTDSLGSAAGRSRLCAGPPQPQHWAHSNSVQPPRWRAVAGTPVINRRRRKERSVTLSAPSATRSSTAS